MSDEVSYLSPGVRRPEWHVESWTQVEPTSYECVRVRHPLCSQGLAAGHRCRVSRPIEILSSVFAPHVSSCGQATFRIDTGNPGISIADDGIAAQLATHAQGEWANDGMPMVPAASWWQPPVVTFMIGSIQVQIPGSKWTLRGGKSVFVRYHRNVLGLPFITAGDLVFDDVALKLYHKPS